MKLIWNPQESFKPFFNTAEEIKKYRSVFKEGIQYMIPYGGRGSGKTWTFADAIIVEASLRPVRVLVTREMQNSIVESIKQELEDAIKSRGLESFFDIQEQVIKGLNGSRFIFKGIKANINNLKSISNVDIVLAEESESITKNSWEKLLPSIRPKSGKDPLFIIIFNPASELDDTYQRFVVNTPPGSVCKLINWRDNEFFPAHLEKQRQHALKTLPKKQYDHIWEGHPLGSSDDVIISLEWIKAARFASQSEGWKRVGKKIVGYDPAGQGRDYNAVAAFDGNVLTEVDEWLKSPDLRQASERAFGYAVRSDSKFFVYDECGGFGDGVSVFIGDAKDNVKKELIRSKQNAKAIDFIKMRVAGFNAGNPVHMPDKKVNGTKKTNGEIYTNLKAQTWGVVAQQFYNTYRYVVLGERDIDMRDMISIDIEDDSVFNKLARELSTPIWEKSDTNSKKKVESKSKMEKRTGQASPNLADAVVMTRSPKLPSGNIGGML
ncbi:terminase large subunit [Vibrio phage 1.273.O._10N.286.54.C7]|nr:terminase large subunit [Vibrio phage 1.273.O._10N.286.54.C7]